MRRSLLLLASILLVGGCAYSSHDPVPRSDGLEPSDAAVPFEPDASEPSDPGPSEGPDGGPIATPIAEHPHPAVSAAIAAWRWRATEVGDVGTPDTARCADLFAGLQIVAPDHRMFRLLCHRCDLTDDAPQCESLGRINACAPWGDPRDDDDGRSHESTALVVLDATLAENPETHDRLVIHESLHHLGWCSLEGADSAHHNDAWWCGDDADCITARAQAAL